MLCLPRNLHMEVHKVLCLPRNLHMEVHKVLCLPRNLHMEVHKVLRLPRNPHMEVHKVLCLPRNLHMEVHKVLRLPRILHMEVHKVLCLPRKMCVVSVCVCNPWSQRDPVGFDVDFFFAFGIFSAGGSGRSFGTATNEDAHLICAFPFFLNGMRLSQEPPDLIPK